MTDDARIANADLAEIARLHAELVGVRQNLTQIRESRDAERAARQTVEAVLTWWHATVAKYVTSASAEDRRLLRDTMAEALTYAHPGATLLAELEAARAVVEAARAACHASLFDLRGPLVTAVARYDWTVQDAQKARDARSPNP